MLKQLSVALSFLAGTALAQTQPGQTTPSVTPSQTPAVTPSQTPGPVPPGAAPVLGGPPPTLGASPVGGLSPCENMIGAERDKCLQAGSAAVGGTQAPMPSGPQYAPPTGSVR
jgi:hypothetical protein